MGSILRNVEEATEGKLEGPKRARNLLASLREIATDLTDLGETADAQTVRELVRAQELELRARGRKKGGLNRLLLSYGMFQEALAKLPPDICEENSE